MSYNRTAKGDQEIPDNELILPADARKLVQELNALMIPGSDDPNFTITPWENKNPDEQVVYTDARRILQLQPGDQDAADLFSKQQANPDGHWSIVDPLHIAWVSSLNKDLNQAGGTRDGGLGAATAQAAANQRELNDAIIEIRDWVRRHP